MLPQLAKFVATQAHRFQSRYWYSSLLKLWPAQGHHVHLLWHWQRCKRQVIHFLAAQSKSQSKFVGTSIRWSKCQRGKDEEFHIRYSEVGGATLAVFQSQVWHQVMGSLKCCGWQSIHLQRKLRANELTRIRRLWSATARGGPDLYVID